jgi:cardiolipin synthase
VNPSPVARSLPNLLSWLRLLIGCAFPFLPTEWRFVTVTVAALTDLADGEASRLLHAESEFGRLLDPVADKVFVAGVVVALLADGSLAWWQAGLVALRDLAVLVGAFWVVLRRGWSACWGMRPRWPGKVTRRPFSSFSCWRCCWGSRWRSRCCLS